MSKIGVLDSGLGGMLMMKHLIQRYPAQDFIFLADQIHSPFGHKTYEQLVNIVNQDIQWLKNQGAESILFACNTISCIQPQDLDQSLRIERVVEPTCAQLSDSKIQKVLVCATPFTVASGVYEKTLSKLYPSLQVESLALPNLCSDVENMTDRDIVIEGLKNQLHPYVHQVDAVVLGCTHFPVYKEAFEQILGCPAYDSNQMTLELVSEGTGEVSYYTTADAAIFDTQCRCIFQMNIVSSKVEL